MDRRAEPDERLPEGEMGGGRSEDVAAVEGRRHPFEHHRGVRHLDGGRDSAEPIGRNEEQAVVRTDVEASVLAAKGHGPAHAADPGIDHGQVNAGRHVRERIGERQCPAHHLLRGNPVRDVDQDGLGSYASDDPVTDAREGILDAEVAQEGDDASRDAASVTARASPSRSCVVASSTTARPPRRAASVVIGPIDTQGRSTRRAANARAAEAEARTTRSPSGNDPGRSSTER